MNVRKWARRGACEVSCDGFPTIAGDWRLFGDWQRQDIHGEVEADVHIAETDGLISMTVRAPGSDSHTLHARWSREASGSVALFYVFQVDPKASGARQHRAYKGAAILRPTADGTSLTGNYWTDDYSKGHYRLERAPVRDEGTGEGRPMTGKRRRPGLWALMSVMILAGILLYLLAPTFHREDAWTSRVRTATTEASRACQLDYTSEQQSDIGIGLAAKLKNLGGTGTTDVIETRRSVDRALSESGRLSDNRSQRECMAGRIATYLAYDPERRQAGPAATGDGQGEGSSGTQSVPTGSGAAVGYVYYEEDGGRPTADGVFQPIGASISPPYGRLTAGTVLRSVRAAELRSGPSGNSASLKTLAAGQCVRILDRPAAAVAGLTSATSGGRLRVQAVSCS